MTTVSIEPHLPDPHQKNTHGAHARSLADVSLADLPHAMAPRIMTRSMSGSKATDPQAAESQQLKDELIEKATARLRRRLLEQRMSDTMSEIIRMQSQLEFMRVDAAATMDAMDKMEDGQHCRLEALERRLQVHQTQLDQLRHAQTSSMERTDSACSRPSAGPMSTFSMSRLSSLSLMSLFSRSGGLSSRATSVSGDDCSDTASTVSSSLSSSCPETLTEAEEQQRRHRRRRRVKQLRQKHQERMRAEDPFYTELKWQTTMKDNDGQEHKQRGVALATPHTSHRVTSTLDSSVAQSTGFPNADMSIYSGTDQEDEALLELHSMRSSSSLSSPRGLTDMPSFAQRLSMRQTCRHPLSPMTPVPMHDDSPFPDVYDPPASPYQDNYDKHDAPWPTDCKLWSQSIPHDYHHDRNVLDDALSFLDSLSENADDGGFGEDIDLLLRHPDLCCRPLSEIRDTMCEIRRRESKAPCDDMGVLRLCLSPWAASHYGAQHMLAVTSSVCDAGWRWCKFLSILSAAVMISLLNGPSDILDN